MNRSHRQPEHRAARLAAAGFTLTELVVAVAITSIIILAINGIFASVTDAVGSGIGASEIIGASRTVAQQVTEDFDQMVGPEEGGFLVITSHTITANVLADDPAAGVPARDFRSDQIAFIRRRGDLEPMAPANANSFSNSSDAAYVRLWLGHCLRTNADGSDPTGDLGATGPNQFASDWVLGRQTLFLDTTPTSANADGAYYDAPSPVLGYPHGTAALYHGLTDIAQYGFQTPSSHGAIVGDAPAATGEDLVAHRLQRSDSAENYATAALNYTYASERLRCNPVPGGNTFSAWQIGQMHPYLAGHVSDVRIDFAGDYDGDGELDTDTDGAIEWYGQGNLPPVNGDGFIAHTDTTTPPVALRPIDVASPAPTLASRAFVFRHGPDGTNWPYLIRVRYRLLDSSGRITSADGEPGRVFELVLPVARGD